MITAQIRCPQMGNVAQYFTKKSKESAALAGNIAVKTGLQCIKSIQLNVPQWTGDLANKGIVGNLVLFKYMARYWIRFPLNYTWFANYGRGESKAKKGKMLRWYSAPHGGTPIFAKSSPATGIFAGRTTFKSGNETLFVERSVLDTLGTMKAIALMELQRWLLM